MDAMRKRMTASKVTPDLFFVSLGEHENSVGNMGMESEGASRPA